jgi:hypothetical protein
MANAMDLLKALEQSLGGPNGAPLLIGCDEPPNDIAMALECAEPDTEYQFCVRMFKGADTYIITARKPTESELSELERLMDETVPDGEPDDDDGDDDPDGDED